MAEREITVKLNLKPGDTAQFKNLFTSPSSPVATAQANIQKQFGGIANNLQKAAGTLSASFRNLGGSLGPTGAGLGLVGDWAGQVFR